MGKKHGEWSLFGPHNKKSAKKDLALSLVTAFCCLVVLCAILAPMAATIPDFSRILKLYHITSYSALC